MTNFVRKVALQEVNVRQGADCNILAVTHTARLLEIVTYCADPA